MSETTTTTTMPDPLGWNSTIWDTLKQAVHQETQRTKILQKILPIYVPSGENDESVPSDVTRDKEPLEIAHGDTRSIIETTAEFVMTHTQVQPEQPLSTALTLATRAANKIAIAQDLLIFQGKKVKLPQFVQAILGNNNVDSLLGEPGRAIKPITVDAIKPASGAAAARSTYGENTFKQVARGIAELQGDGHYGPYALVLHSNVFADTHAPLQNTLIMPADRIRPLVEERFYGTGTLPENRGVLLSLGGNTMDLVVPHDAAPEYLSYARGNGGEGARYSFQVRERFTLRLKDKTAVRRLEFE